jgi:hypothetical protein
MRILAVVPDQDLRASEDQGGSTLSMVVSPTEDTICALLGLGKSVDERGMEDNYGVM